MHTREIAALREKAVLADMEEAKALLEASRQYARLTWRFRNAAERKEPIEAAAGGQWSRCHGTNRLSGLACCPI